MTMRSLLAVHGLRPDGSKCPSPYDAPRGLVERLTFPSLRQAWFEGYAQQARDEHLRTFDPTPPDNRNHFEEANHG